MRTEPQVICDGCGTRRNGEGRPAGWYAIFLAAEGSESRDFDFCTKDCVREHAAERIGESLK